MPPGAVFGLLGSDGAGKTTTIRGGLAFMGAWACWRVRRVASVLGLLGLALGTGLSLRLGWRRLDALE